MSLISVIVPVYNVEKFLSKCIDSLINQTLTDIEIILVDDGSTDLSSEICDSYAKIDKRINVIHKENEGLSEARNTGIRISKGQYICFVDSDDWISNDMCERLYTLLIDNNADIAQCNHIKVYSNDDILDNKIKEEIRVYEGESMLYNLHNKNYVNTVVTWNKIYKRELFNDIEFPKGKLHEDEFTTYKVLHKSKKIVVTNIPMYYYRQRLGSIINSEFNIKRLDLIEAWEEKIEYYNANKLYNLSLKTEAALCGRLKEFYLITLSLNNEETLRILKILRKKMIKNYFKFIKNKEITLKGKLSLSLSIIDGKIYNKLYKKYINNSLC